MILCSNPRAQYLTHRVEIDAAIRKVLDGGTYILGEEVSSFEREFSAYIGVSHGVGVGSGTDALHLALSACGIAAGDEVITVSHTAVATVAAIEMAGATPVFVDIEPEHYTMDPRGLDSAITARTKAIVPVHLYGQAADIDPILAVARRHGFKVIEDGSQAHGAMYHDGRIGSRGDAGCFSFYPTKNLGALGDGGMLVTNDAEISSRARRMREYGWDKKRISRSPGLNTRLDEIQAAVLRVKLRHLDEANERRRARASLYNDLLIDLDIGLPGVRNGATHAYHLYVIRSDRRDELRGHLKERGIDAGVHYPMPVHRQPAYAGRLQNLRELTHTDAAASAVLSLPMYPELAESDVRLVAESIRECFVRL